MCNFDRSKIENLPLILRSDFDELYRTLAEVKYSKDGDIVFKTVLKHTEICGQEFSATAPCLFEMHLKFNDNYLLYFLNDQGKKGAEIKKCKGSETLMNYFSEVLNYRAKNFKDLLQFSNKAFNEYMG